MTRKTYKELRSARWFAPKSDFRAFGHRSRMLQIGYSEEDWGEKPIVGILNTWSDISPCHMHFKQRVEDVKRGVLQAGGFPIELPTLSVGEVFVKPTTMLYRNMLAMEVEELIRSHPIDGVVLMGGCDKSTPGLVMGSISAGVPMIYLPAGPMLRGNWEGKTLGSGSDAFKYWDEKRAGTITDDQWSSMMRGTSRSYGTCMTMGTASTMTAIAEALGLCLPGASSIPAVDANHIRMASNCGRRVVDMIWEDLTPEKILTSHAFENANTVAMATGCSTNAVIHLIAMARRAGIPLTLDDLDKKSRTTPVIANIRPAGDKYLMEDFFYAGGLTALMKELGDRLHLDCLTVTGNSIGKNIENAKIYNDDVIRSVDNPIYHEGSLAVLKGNLAPDGAVVKPVSLDQKFLVHQGPAYVFDSYAEMKDKLDDEDWDVTPDTVLVLRNTGPKGGPGMPEWGMIPMPKALLLKGHRDMVRLSDARMSGTSFGACVLHISPESHVGGPLAFLKTGDIISLDVPNRKLDMLVDEEELERRKAAWVAPQEKYGRGYGWMYLKHIQQADKGCDFDYLETDFGPAIEEPEIH